MITEIRIERVFPVGWSWRIWGDPNAPVLESGLEKTLTAAISEIEHQAWRMEEASDPGSF